MSGERALLAAVLGDAVLCLRGRLAISRHRSRLRAEARAWMTSRDTSWPFSFENVCDALGMDPGRLRAQLLEGAPEEAEVGPRPPRGGRPVADPKAIRDMIRAGCPLRVVAARFGISVPHVSALSSGLATSIRLERDGEIRRLRAEGWSYAALGHHFCLSAARVRRICSPSTLRRLAHRPITRPDAGDPSFGATG